MEKIILEIENKVAFVILNNPAKMNCMGFQMLHELEETLSEVERNADVHVVVFKGAGERAFSTGADLKEFQSLSGEKASEWIEYGNQVFNQIENLKKPTVAFINGYAMGGGLELALACDFRIGTESAILCSPELQHGWLPGWGGMTRLRRLLGEVKAKEVIMLCEKIPAREALEMGLLNRIENEDGTVMMRLLEHLGSLKNSAFVLAKTALQNPNRTTSGVDIQFDVLAMQIAK